MVPDIVKNRTITMPDILLPTGLETGILLSLLLSWKTINTPLFYYDEFAIIKDLT